MPVIPNPLWIKNGTAPYADQNHKDGARVASATVTGTGFGVAPNVVLFRTFNEGTSGDLIQAAAPLGEVGAFTSMSADARYVEFGGRKAFSGFFGGSKQEIWFENGSEYQRFRSTATLCVTDTGFMPGQDGQGLRTYPIDSGWKPVWHMKDADGSIGTNGKSDIVLPTHTGSGLFNAAGNSVSPASFRFQDPGESFWEWNDYNTFSFAQRPDVTNPKTVDGFNALFMTSAADGTNQKTRTYPSFMGNDANVTDANAGYNLIKFNPFARSDGQSQCYISDLYLSVESTPGAEDFWQCAMVGDNAAFADCTILRPIVATSWSDTSVTIDSSFGLGYYHIIKPDNTVVSGALV